MAEGESAILAFTTIRQCPYLFNVTVSNQALAPRLHADVRGCTSETVFGCGNECGDIWRFLPAKSRLQSRDGTPIAAA